MVIVMVGCNALLKLENEMVRWVIEEAAGCESWLLANHEKVIKLTPIPII